ncbi:MAG: hypothetical protein H6719_18385 [Sandaracinaceae bacterium]|nr:hypothetical protein [Sandaracinaceae bacterium]
MEAFADLAQRRFEEAQVRRLLGDLGVDATIDEDALRRYVAHVVRNALAWGIEEVEEVQQLIDWCRDEGPDFHLVAGREELRALLEDPSVAGFAKIDVLREDLFEAEPDARG